MLTRTCLTIAATLMLGGIASAATDMERAEKSHTKSLKKAVCICREPGELADRVGRLKVLSVGGTPNRLGIFCRVPAFDGAGEQLNSTNCGDFDAIAP